MPKLIAFVPISVVDPDNPAAGAKNYRINDSCDDLPPAKKAQYLELGLIGEKSSSSADSPAEAAAAAAAEKKPAAEKKAPPASSSRKKAPAKKRPRRGK